jgi:hypothetical protein
MTRSEQLADAMLLIAKCNHYMVGLVESVTPDEIDAAEQILITGQNNLASQSSLFKRYDLALDLIENMRRTALSNASHGSVSS